MPSITPSNPFPTSGGSRATEEISARTRGSFGGKPVHRPKQATPLLWAMKGLFRPLTRKEETGEDATETRTIPTVPATVNLRERAIGTAQTERTTSTTPTTQIGARNVAWNRTVFDFVHTLSLDDFGIESFNKFLGYASMLLCQNPSKEKRMDPSLANALTNEVLRLPIQDRQTVLMNLATFQNDLLRTSQETGTLYETSAQGLIPNGQFAGLVDQMLSLILILLQPKPKPESGEQ